MNARPRKEIDTSTYEGRFAARLKMLREKAGLSVDELAEKTGINRATIFRWEGGSISPPVSALPVLAKAIGIKTARLLPKDE